MNRKELRKKTRKERKNITKKHNGDLHKIGLRKILSKKKSE